MSSGSRLLPGGHGSGHRSRVSALVLRRLVVGSALALGLLTACGGPPSARGAEQAGQPQLAASALRLTIVDHRPAPVGDQRAILELPADFEASAQERLARLTRADGAVLDVHAVVVSAQAQEIVDARGEMTRIEVSFDFETRIAEGPVLKRGRGQSQQDIPRDEADDAEIGRVLSATALDAFDRYWRSSETLDGLNRELAAYRDRRRSE
jgi:hypothetical protein